MMRTCTGPCSSERKKNTPLSRSKEFMNQIVYKRDEHRMLSLTTVYQDTQAVSHQNVHDSLPRFSMPILLVYVQVPSLCTSRSFIGKLGRRWHDQSELINGCVSAECQSRSVCDENALKVGRQLARR